MQKCLLEQYRIIIVFLLAYFSLTTAILFFIPPWQGADEPTHFEQIIITAKNGIFNFNSNSHYDYPLERKIIRSLDKNNFWEFTGVSKPTILPERFQDTPFLANLPSQWMKPHFYYHIAAILLKILPKGENDLILKLYGLRFLSLLLSIISLILIYKLGTQVYGDQKIPSMIIFLFVLLLPQFAISSVVVTNDSLFLTLYLLFLTILLSIKIEAPSKLKIFFLILVIILIINTDRAGLITIPVSIFYFIRKLTRTKILEVTKWFFPVILGILIGFPILNWFYPTLVARFSDSLSLYYLRLNIGELVLLKAKISLIEFFRVLFTSFICAAGWTRFTIPLRVTILLAILVGISFLGLFVNKKAFPPPKNRLAFQTMQFNLLVIFIALFIVYWIKGFQAQGRFLFPALWSIAFLFCQGFLSFMKKMQFSDKHSIIILILMLFLLSNFTLIRVIIPAFYIPY